MEEIGSRVSESGASNESLHNTSSPNDASEIEANVDTSKKRKVMEPRAACWKHFDKFMDENGTSKAKCKHCGKVYATSTKDGLKEIGDSIKRVRQAMKYIKQSPARIRKFKECCESQMITCKKSLCLDVPTRWNSTYLMFDTAQHFELAFERYSFYDIGLLDHLRTYPCEDGTSAGILTSDDWENVRSMVKFLETFYFLTLKVSGSKYVTNNVHFVEIAELDLILKEMMENENVNLKEMAKNMRTKLRKNWGEPGKMNKMIFISSVLDPRNKFEYVPFAIVDMFGKEIGEKLIKAVKTYMRALFDYYVKKSSKNSLFPSSPTSFGNSSITSTVNGYDNYQKKGRMRTKQQFEKHKEVSGV